MSRAYLLQYTNGESRHDGRNSQDGRSDVHADTAICDIYKISVYIFFENPYAPTALIPYTLAVNDSSLLGCYTM
jgi:hypothetical protein